MVVIGCLYFIKRVQPDGPRTGIPTANVNRVAVRAVRAGDVLARHRGRLCADSASRGAAVPSRHRCDSCPSDEVVGGFFFDFVSVDPRVQCTVPTLGLEMPLNDATNVCNLGNIELGRGEIEIQSTYDIVGNHGSK